MKYGVIVSNNFLLTINLAGAMRSGAGDRRCRTFVGYDVVADVAEKVGCKYEIVKGFG